MVDFPRQDNPNAIPIDNPSAQYDHRVRCLQHGIGYSTGQTAHRREVVPEGSLTQHKLPGVTGCFSDTTLAKHLPGKDNFALDQEWRSMWNHCDRMLNPQVY